MARIRTLVFIDPLANTAIIVVDGDPSVAPGITQGVGSIAIGPTGQIYQKTTVADTGWILSGEARLTRDRVLGTVGAAIGGTDTAVATGAFDFQIGAGIAGAFNTFKHKAAVAAGTALAAGTLPLNTWGAYLFTIPASGVIACAAAPLNFTTGYATEALAKADALALVDPASSARVVLVTVLTAVGQTFIGGTDSLHTGASGHVASQTNYYEFGSGL